MNRPFILLTLLLTLFVQKSFADKPLVKRNYGKDTTIEVIDMFDNANTRSGYHPYLVKLNNNTAKEITWKFNFKCTNDRNQNNTSYSHSITVESGSDAVEEIYVPIPINLRRFSYTITAGGLPTLRDDTSIWGVELDWPAIAMSKPLALKSLTGLAAAKEKRYNGREYFASTYTELPTKWKGYTCLDAFMIDEKTWLDSSKQQRKAIMTWVRFGGSLHIYTTKGKPSFASLKLEEPEKGFANNKGALIGGTYGLGQLSVYKWDGASLDDKIVSRYRPLHRFDHSLMTNFGKSWKLIDQFGEKNFNPTFVFFLLIIFAVLVGPVNLFHFAKAGQRQRLFITTPIISILAALIIMAIILVQDGIGGSGRRIAFMEIQSDPEQRQSQIIQQQVSRTGVMVNSGFSNEDLPQISPVTLRTNQFATSSSSFDIKDGQYSGDFFRSRNQQGYYLRSVSPTRSRIELRNQDPGGGGKPNLTSTLDFEVQNFYYIDSAGTVWATLPDETVKPGESITLQKSNAKDLIENLKGLTAGFGRFERDRIRAMQEHRNRYFAEAVAPKKLMIPTHRSIRWRDGTMIVSGRAVAP